MCLLDCRKTYWSYIGYVGCNSLCTAGNYGVFIFVWRGGEQDKGIWNRVRQNNSYNTHTHKLSQTQREIYLEIQREAYNHHDLIQRKRLVSIVKVFFFHFHRGCLHFCLAASCKTMSAWLRINQVSTIKRSVRYQYQLPNAHQPFCYRQFNTGARPVNGI